MGNTAHGPRCIRVRPYRTFFLCLFLRKRFLRLCVAILCRFRFLPQGIFFGVF